MAFSCPYSTEGEIRQLDFFQCDEILRSNGVVYDNLETEKEVQDLILKHLLLPDSTREITRATTPSSEETQCICSSAEIIEKIISRDKEIKEALTDVYGDLKDFFHIENFENDENLIKELSIEFNDFRKNVNECSQALVEEECPIVVAGETSSGKSSLLNLLLGSDILPYSLLASTSTICRLRNCERKSVEVVHRADNRVEVMKDITGDENSETLRMKLQDYLSPKQREANPYKYVDLYWPIPFLRTNVIIVDTPGIGESDEMTNRLLEYLPNAVAFIYVINSANAGGVQSDRLLKILESQKKRQAEGKLQTFDCKYTMFVCNKWDQVSLEERDKVWQNTLQKLQVWPGFDESRVFKLSTTEASRRYSNGLNYTEYFRELLKGIEKLVPDSLESRAKQHAVWLERLIKKIMLRITARINNTRLGEDEKKRKQKLVEERLKKLKHDNQKVQNKLSALAEKECEEISNGLFNNLQSEECFNRMFNWCENELPNGNDIEVIRLEISNMVQSRINQEIQQWCRRNNIQNRETALVEELKKECKIIEQECKGIDDFIKNIGNRLGDSLHEETGHENVTELELSTHLFTLQEKVALAITSPLWFPLMVLAVTIAAPIAGVIAVKDVVQEKRQLKQYLSNKKVTAEETAQNTLRGYTVESINKRLESSFLSVFNQYLQQFYENFIPQQIQADEQLIKHIQDDMRDSEEIRHYYKPLERKARNIAGKILYVKMQYFNYSMISQDNIVKGEVLGSGSFAHVYKATVKSGRHNYNDIAVKCFISPLDCSECYLQLSEVETLMSLNHENIVKLLGISCEEINHQRHLMILMELCECNLESLVIARGNHAPPKPICSNQDKWDTPEMTEAYAFFATVLLDVCLGVSYIHKQEFVHRDLKPSNILMKNGIAKIGDVGFAKDRQLVTGTIVGTPSHMAPEVLESKLYDHKADVYSIGILFWEIWYGRVAYCSDHFENAQKVYQHVLGGYRPQFHISKAPPSDIQTIMKQCWEAEPEKRLCCDRIYEKLKIISASKKIALPRRHL